MSYAAHYLTTSYGTYYSVLPSKFPYGRTHDSIPTCVKRRHNLCLDAPKPKQKPDHSLPPLTRLLSAEQQTFYPAATTTTSLLWLKYLHKVLAVFFLDDKLKSPYFFGSRYPHTIDYRLAIPPSNFSTFSLQSRPAPRAIVLHRKERKPTRHEQPLRPDYCIFSEISRPQSMLQPTSALSPTP